MNAKQLHCMGLLEAAQAIRRGDLSSEDLTRALLERIARHENTVQAFQWIDPARALDLARRADRRLRSGAAVGPLHGIPIGIKDIIETQGIPTSMGSPIFDGYVPASSATLVRRVEAAGAFVMGKTVTTEFAYFTPGRPATRGTRPTHREDPPAARQRRWPWGFCPGRSAPRPTVR